MVAAALLEAAPEALANSSCSSLITYKKPRSKKIKLETYYRQPNRLHEFLKLRLELIRPERISRKPRAIHKIHLGLAGESVANVERLPQLG